LALFSTLVFSTLRFTLNPKPGASAPAPSPLQDTPWQSLQLSHETSEPYYRQLQRQIKLLIASGNTPGGSNLPSERDMAAALGLSRTTIKRCYDELRASKHLATHGRDGTQVQSALPRVSPVMGRLKSFSDEMRELGKEPGTRLIERSVTTDRTIASMFGRASTAEFLRLVRVRSGDGQPMTREVAWYDLTLAPALADWDVVGSSYKYLADVCNVPVMWAEQTVESVFSSPEETETFGYPSAQPCLLFKRKTFTAGDALIEYAEGTFRGDAYVYKIRLEA
jgi:GntR family transcriptional regulator